MMELRPVRGHGSWRHAAFHVATTIATPAAYAPLPFALASLGWPAGVATLVAGTIVTYYSSILLASLWEWDGVSHVRYRDLARSIFGTPGFWAVTFFQQLASLGNNIAIQIAAGSSLKAIYQTYRHDNHLTLQQFIVIFGVFELGLSQFPSIHSLRWVNCICTMSTLGFAATTIGVSVYNGMQLDRSTISYELHGTTSGKLFGILNALGTIAFSFGDAMLPEIQCTLKEPAKKHMYKGISAAYLVIVATYWTLACVGYWAFGSTVSPYLPSSLSGPKWVILLVNLFAVIQIAGCYQIYCRPTYQYLEGKLLDEAKGVFSCRNWASRLVVTGMYMGVITLTAAALPFFGDFVALCGAFGFTPLDFIIPAIAYLLVRRPTNPLVVMLNLGMALTYLIVAMLGSVGAIRFIAVDASTYRFFRDL